MSEIFEFLGRALGAFVETTASVDPALDVVAGMLGGDERRNDGGERIVYERYLTRPRDPKINDR